MEGMPHLVLEAYGVDYATLSNYRGNRDFLRGLVDAIGMELVDGPFCRTHEGASPIETVYAWFAIIATSHVSMTLYPHQGWLSLDVFSCNEFDPELVVQLLEQRFHTHDLDVHPIVRRATRSPRPLVGV